MIKVRFVWPYKGTGVFVAGDFNKWQLEKVSEEFELGYGYYEYKFYVDGTWCYDICKPNVKNCFGSRNNIIRNTNKVKIIHVSDTHSSFPVITETADIFIHTGDFSIGGHPEEYKMFNQWLDDLKIPHKIVILGNHDLEYFNGDQVMGKKLLTNATVLNTESIIIDNIKIFGVEWQKFNTWNFMSESDYKNAYLGGWHKIPNDTDIVLTHQPPHGILDDDKYHWGSHSTLQVIKRVKPKYHLFGHIHQAYGHKEIDVDGSKIKFYNSSLMDEFSKSLVNKYQIIYY